MKQADDWLVAECAHGIGVLLALGLPYRPELEAARAAAAAWAYAIANNTALKLEDALRVRAAFAQLAGTSKQWPTPADLIRALPRREPPPDEYPKLTRADDSAERAALAHMGSVLGFANLLTTIGKEPTR
jgi:hypothetical protein